jgi:solute carrier family 35 (GDP-fucose transporter), member C1
VLSNSPDLPLVFLLLQLLIAVILLHASAAVSKAIDLPTFDIQVAKKLTPVVLVNIIGLVFNTLCLRDVEASFFQVMTCLAPVTCVNDDLAHVRLQEALSFPSQSWFPLFILVLLPR